MKKIMILMIGLVILAMNVAAEDWTMFQNDLAHTGYTTNDAPDDISILEKTFTAIGGIHLSSPIISGGYVYVSDQNITYQLDASDVSVTVATFINNGSNIVEQSAVIVHNGFVYVTDNIATIFKLKASDISTLITSYTAPTSEMKNAPIIAGNYIYFGSGDTIYQLNLSLDLIQSYDIGFDDVGTSSITYANGYIYVSSYDGQIRQFIASDISSMYKNYSLGGGYARGAPTYYSGSIYAGSDSGVLYKLDADDISVKEAEYTTGEILSSAACGNNYIYLVAGTKFYQFDTNLNLIVNITLTDTVNYSFDNSQGAPAVTSDYVFMARGSTIIQFNASDISHMIANYTTTDVIHSAPIIADGYLYITSDKLYQLGEGAAKAAQSSSSSATSRGDVMYCINEGEDRICYESLAAYEESIKKAPTFYIGKLGKIDNPLVGFWNWLKSLSWSGEGW